MKGKVSKEVYLAMVAKDVRYLMSKRTDLVYRNPVAQERSEVMRKKFNYNPVVVDAFTLRPDSNQIR